MKILAIILISLLIQACGVSETDRREIFKVVVDENSDDASILIPKDIIPKEAEPVVEPYSPNALTEKEKETILEKLLDGWDASSFKTDGNFVLVEN